MRNFLFAFLAIPNFLFAQVNVGVSATNYLRYGTGKETVGTVSQRRDYFENLLESKVTISDFLIGFRLLHDAPPEFGREFSGLRKRYVEFTHEDLYIRAGNSFTLFGRGLLLNSFENRALAFDTGIDGLKLEYKTRVAKAAFTAGDISYTDVLDSGKTENYRVRGGSVELMPYPFLSLGGSFVSGNYTPPPFLSYNEPARFDMPEIFGRVQVANFDLYLSYAEKRTKITAPLDTSKTHYGTAFYGSLSYTAEAIGVSFEYKDYRFGIVDPAERNKGYRAVKAYAFQNAPIVHKEHSFTLLSRNPHVIDFGDEVGYQMDVFFTFGQFTGSANGSVASRHYSFAVTDTVYIPGTTIPYDVRYGSKLRSSSFLPSLDAKYSPFWEVYADLQYYLEDGGTDYILLGFNRRSTQIANEQILLGGAHSDITFETTQVTSVPLSAQYTVMEGWALKFVMERQWVFEEKNPAQPRYYNHLLSLGISKSPDYSVTLRYEFTSDHATVDSKRNWTTLDLSFHLGANHLITLTAGGNRGGLVCANGVCRTVNPFLGFRASVLSYL